MPVPQVTVNSEREAYRLGLAITRLTGQCPFIYQTGLRFIVATDDLDAAELRELAFVCENSPGLPTRPMLR